MKRYFKFILPLCAVTVLAGCSGTKPSDVVITNTQYQVDSSLTQAAQQAVTSLDALSTIEKAKFPQDTTVPFPNVHSQALDQFITVQWYGPIAPLLQQIAQKIGYQLQVFGKAPATPILISIDDTQNKTSAVNLLRNVDLQAANNASVVLFPQAKIISLRYNAS